jgi:hypothetical protein
MKPASKYTTQLQEQVFRKAVYVFGKTRDNYLVKTAEHAV